MAVVAAVSAGLAAAVLAGCGQMAASLSQTWVNVSFRQNTSVATVLHVREVCSHVPHVTAPAIRRARAIDMVSSLRFDTTNASNANVAELQVCLQKFPAVNGVDLEDSSDEGG